MCIICNTNVALHSLLPPRIFWRTTSHRNCVDMDAYVTFCATFHVVLVCSQDALLNPYDFITDI